MAGQTGTRLVDCGSSVGRPSGLTAARRSMTKKFTNRSSGMITCGNGAGRHTRKSRVAALVAGALAALGSAGGSNAMTFDTRNPDLSVRWDNTIRYNLSMRAERKDPRIANAPTTDESDNKFDRGDIVNNRIDLLTELDLMYKEMTGFRVSAAGWYDYGYHDTTVKTAPGLESRASYNDNQCSSFTK